MLYLNSTQVFALRRKISISKNIEELFNVKAMRKALLHSIPPQLREDLSLAQKMAHSFYGT